MNGGSFLFNMKQYVIRKDVKGLEALERREFSPAAPGPGEIAVRVRAVSLNYRDKMITVFGAGDLVPLSDGAGEVVEIGTGVTEFQVGDRVAGTFFPKWVEGDLDDAKFAVARGGGATHGMLSEIVVGDEKSFVRLPKGYSFAEGATLPCAAVTAWHALDGVKPGETVLLQGTGGVSIFGLQLAKSMGARVILISSSDDKLARARELGADELVNYRKSADWEVAAKALTNGRGVDRILEVGGGGTLGKSLEAIRRAGTISLIGVLTGLGGEVNPTQIVFKSVHVNGIYVGSRAQFLALNRALEISGIRPQIDRIYSFDDAVEAYRHLESGKHFGKIVIEL